MCQPVLETIRLLVCAKGWAQISLIYYNPRVILLLPLVLNNLRIIWLSVLKVYFFIMGFLRAALLTMVHMIVEDSYMLTYFLDNSYFGLIHSYLLVMHSLNLS